jgi:hypothetical protein
LVMEGVKWKNIGARPGHYPADARALVNWVKPLRNWVRANRQPATARLQADELLELHQMLMNTQ